MFYGSSKLLNENEILGLIGESPMNYIGGKYKLLPQLIELMVNYFDKDHEEGDDCNE